MARRAGVPPSPQASARHLVRPWQPHGPRRPARWRFAQYLDFGCSFQGSGIPLGHWQPRGYRTPSLASLRGSCLCFEFAGSVWSSPVSTVGPQTKVALRATFWLAGSRHSPGLACEGGWSRGPRPGSCIASRKATARHPWQAFAAPAMVCGRGTGAMAFTSTSRRAPKVALRALFGLAGWRSAPFLATRGWVPAGGSAPAGVTPTAPPAAYADCSLFPPTTAAPCSFFVLTPALAYLT